MTPTSDAYEVRKDVKFGAIDPVKAASAKSEDGPRRRLGRWPSGLANTDISGALW